MASSFFDPGEEIRKWIGDIATQFLNQGMKFAASYISSPTNLNKVPFIDDLITGAILIGNLVCILFFYKRVIEALRNLATEEEQTNWAEIIGSTAISLGFCNITPWLIRYYVIPLSNQLVKWLSNFPINVHVPGHWILDIFAPGTSIAMASIDILLMVFVWSVFLIALGISAMIRYGQLALLIVTGPIFAASYTNRSEVYKAYWAEVIGVVFTQVIHMLMFMLVVATVAKGSFEYLLMSFAFIVVALIGPTAFKQILHSTGTKRGFGAVAQIAVYRTMMSGFKKG